MNASLPAGAHPLRHAIEEHADIISNSAQIVLESLDTEETPEMTQRDLSRIHESAVDIYRLVHSQLTADHFDRIESKEDELHRIRHDLRGLLQNVLLRCQMVLEDDGIDCGEKMSESACSELERILEHARLSVEALDVNRDESSKDDPPVLDFSPQEELATNGVSPASRVEEAKILIADDNENSREMLGRFLTSEGHIVAEAGTGKEALECLEKEDYDLLLLDLMMPEMNGFEVLETLKKNGTLRHLPVIVISGLDSNANALLGIELGAEDFLPRPVNLKLLRARANTAVERRRLREKELAAYFTPELARYLLRHPEELTRGRSAEVSVLFCDIASFSRISDRLGAELAINWVSDTLTAMSACVMDEKGVLVDYTGDEVMAMWGAPGDQPDHAERACRCAISMRKKLPEIDAKWKEIIGEATELSIGVNTGEAFVGNIGTPQKFKFGPLGTTVNLASRVQSATKFVRSRMLISGDTRERIGDGFETRKVAEVVVNNIDRPVRLFELDATTDGTFEELRKGYEKALGLFEKADFRAASALLGKLSLQFPDDGPTLLLMSRVVQELLRDGSGDFDPVWRLPGK